MMTQQAQAALRRVIEQYTKNVRFCIICNYVNKIAPAIQSRCTRFRFSPLPISEIQKKVDTVVEAEKYVCRSYLAWLVLIVWLAFNSPHKAKRPY